VTLVVLGYTLFTPKRPHRVLIIQSYEETCRSAQALTAEIIKDLKKENIRPDVKCLYLDCESFLEKAEIKRMSHLLDSISAGGWKPEVILVNDDQATYSLLKSRHSLTHTTPIVFAGVNFPNWKLIKEFPNVTGWEDRIDILNNLLFIKRIRKSPRGLYTVIDSTFIDRKIRADIMNVAKRIKLVGFMTPNIPLKEQQWLIDQKGYLSLEDFPARGEHGMSANLLWIISNFGKYKAYLNLKRDFTTVNVARINSNYSFTAINEEYGYGHNLLAGYFTPIEIQAKDQVEYAAKILDGVPVSKLPIKQSKKQFMADWEVMQNYHLTMDDFPAYCKFSNIAPIEEYPTTFFFICFTLSALFIILFFYLSVLYRRERKRKKAVYDTMMREREILKLALEGSNTFAWSMKNDMITFDSSFWKYVNKPPRAISIEEMVNFVHPSNIKQYQDFIADPSQSKSIQIMTTFDRRDYQWWTIRCSSATMSNNEIRTSGVIFNIQEYKDKEEELKKARILAEKAEMKQSFFANMSHEIRTPLNAILGFTSILTDTENLTQDERLEYTQIVKDSSKELLNLVDEVLMLTEIDSGIVLFNAERKNVKDVIQKVYSDFMPKVPAHLTLEQEEDTVDVQINTDVNHLSDVIVHLLSNAVKFTESGTITIGYHYYPQAKEVEIYVKDTGHGIPQDELSLVFSRFYKRDIFTPGVGLGLSVCKTIVDKLKGRLTASSEVGKGSCFSVYLRCEVISQPSE
jgi:signal transduction histidine kinase